MRLFQKDHATIRPFTRICALSFNCTTKKLSYTKMQLHYRGLFIVLYDSFVSQNVTVWLISLPPACRPRVHVLIWIVVLYQKPDAKLNLVIDYLM